MSDFRITAPILSMSKLLQIFFAAVVVFNLLACGDDSGSLPSDQQSVEEQPDTKPLPITSASGFIRGQSWSFQSGRARIFRSGRVPVLEVIAFSESHKQPCEPYMGTSTLLRVLVQPREAVYELGSAPFDIYPNLFFIDYTKFREDPRYSLAANDGRIQVVAIQEEFAVLRMEASYRGTENFGRTEVSGQIVVPLCR